MGKVGRNDSCPCGSGKKYKRCCLNDVGYAESVGTYSEPASPTYPFLKRHNTFDLLKTFAALSVLPENHGKYFRLEQLGIHSILAKNEGLAVVTAGHLKQFLDAEFAMESMEDICVNPFTDLISFFDGDYLIFPGITENGTEILANQLNSIFHWPGADLPKSFQIAIRDLAILGLLLSDTIAKRLGYSRFMDALPEDDLIYVPDDERLQSIKSAVTFSKAEIDELLAANRIMPEALDLLQLNISSIQEEHLYSEENPILNYPLVWDGDNYIVVQPFSIVKALTAKIWSMAERGKIADKVYSAYHDMLWNNAQARLQMLGFHPVSVAGINDQDGIQANVFKFDTNKVAYVSYIGDYGKHTALNPDNTQKHIAIINADAKYGNYQKIIFHIISGVGRTLYRMVPRVEGVESINIPVFDLDVLWRVGETDAIDLWKFSLARKKLLAQAREVFMFSEFLDQYKLFKDKSESFYISDEALLVIPQIVPGYAREWLINAKHKGDLHSIPLGKGANQVRVIVERKSGTSPIYVHIPDAQYGILRFAVEGEHSPIWVMPINKPKKASSELHSFYYQITDAVAYWLWQIMHDVAPLIAPLGSDPIVVNFSLNPIDKFEKMERDFKRAPVLISFFSTELTDEGFHIKIPAEIIPYLYGSDNEGERVMVRHLIDGFNKILGALGQPIIEEEQINTIIEKQAPLGRKKKFFILDSADNLLIDPSNLSHFRFVQEYDVSVVLDSIVPGLGETCPPIGEINEKDDRNELAKKIANEVLMSSLIAKLDKLDRTVLLQRLIGLNESLIRKREELRIHTPPRIACYVSVEEEIELVMKSLGDINRSTLAVRCLIEQIAAQPPSGNQRPSMTDIDEVMAIMDQIISFGSTSDHIHFNLFDIQMGILPSGRIGTEKEIHNNVFDPYFQSKMAENVENAVATFNQVFPKNENIVGGNIPEKLDAAFVADYEISFTRIAEFIDGLLATAYQQKTDYAVLPLNDLRAEINKHVAEFSETEFNTAIDYL